MDNSICPPAHLLPFLIAKGSLTTLLEQKAGQPLHVQIIYEGHQPIDYEKYFSSIFNFKNIDSNHWYTCIAICYVFKWVKVKED